MRLLAFALFLYFAYFCTSAPIPIVLWHGMGDSCCFPFSMGKITKVLQEQISGVFVHSIRIGNNIEEDVISSYLSNSNDQVQKVCQQLKQIPELENGFHAIGFSQGGQFLRAYVERCNQPKVFNLISIGGQHNGVFGLPKCPGINSTLCEWIRASLDIGAYEPFIQKHLVQASYWHDPRREQQFRQKSIFLSDINNLTPNGANQTYKSNILTLKTFVMVKFLQDTMVQPRSSQHFGYYKPGQDKEEVPLQELDIYTNDWLGLRTLDQQKKLVFLESNSDHLQFTLEWFIEQIVNPFLRG